MKPNEKKWGARETVPVRWAKRHKNVTGGAKKRVRGVTKEACQGLAIQP